MGISTSQRVICNLCQVVIRRSGIFYILDRLVEGRRGLVCYVAGRHGIVNIHHFGIAIEEIFKSVVDAQHFVAIFQKDFGNGADNGVDTWSRPSGTKNGD